MKMREEFLQLRNDRKLEIKFIEIQLDVFWIKVLPEFPLIWPIFLTVAVFYNTVLW